ncbi:hypothetical protein D9M69_561790 [compost metagenome]
MLDVGDVGREVLHAADGVQRLADELDVGARQAHQLAAVAGPLLAVGIVLVEQVDLLHVRRLLDVVGQRLHLHRRVGLGLEVPEAAALAGHLGVDRGVVQHDQFLARVALVPARHGQHQRRHHRRARAARDDGFCALVDGRLQRALAFLRRELAVELQQLQLHAAEHAALGVDVLDGVLRVHQHQLAHVGERPRQRIDVGDLVGRLLGLRCRAGDGKQRGKGDPRQRRMRELHEVSPEGV